MDDHGGSPAQPAGAGENLFSTTAVRGEVRWFRTPADVVSCPHEELGGLVAFVYQGGMTFLSPILPDLRAVVCTAGSVESHLALLARELEVPCIMAARLDVPIDDGADVLLELEDPSVARILLSPEVQITRR
jgi:phosphohistidine swiveling domain-containing protein